MVSALAKTSAVSESTEFQHPETDIPTCSNTKEWGRVDAGTQVSIHATVSGGVYPYHFTWKDDMQQAIQQNSLLSVTPQKRSITHFLPFSIPMPRIQL